MSYQQLLGDPRSTPQSKQARSDQIPNNAGGWSFQAEEWAMLDRFLLIGTDAGTYYVNAKDLTDSALKAVRACLDLDGLRTVSRIVEISVAGRAVKNDPAIVALALAVSHKDNLVRQAAIAAVKTVCRTGTHILHFASYADKLRGWGRTLRRAVAAWYQPVPLDAKGIDNLAYQMVKYQARDGWSHADLIRLSHVGSNDPACAALFDWALHGWKDAAPGEDRKLYPHIVKWFEEAKRAEPGGIAMMVKDFGLSREMIPTEKLNDPAIAKALALSAPPTAMLRNLGNQAKAGLHLSGSDTLAHVLGVLNDPAALKKARVHPISVLIALKTYEEGHGVRGSNTWIPAGQVVDALDRAFYNAFEAVESLGKRLALALDCSSSMTAPCIGTPGFSAAQAGAAMALVTASTEKDFTPMLFGTTVLPWSLSSRQRLDDVMRRIPDGGGTNVAAPIQALTASKQSVDAIIIYTDGETWHGQTHPYQAMAAYRQAINPKAKLVLVAMAANEMKLNAPEDSLSLTICGFDTSIPEVIRAFLAE